MKNVLKKIWSNWNIWISSIMLVISLILYYKGDIEAGRHFFLVSMTFLILFRLDLIYSQREEK